MLLLLLCLRILLGWCNVVGVVVGELVGWVVVKIPYYGPLHGRLVDLNDQRGLDNHADY